jgi:hypothetical protein
MGAFCFHMKKSNFLVYLDSNCNPVPQTQATQVKVVEGTNRQSFFLALIRDMLPSKKVSYLKVKR